MKIYFLSSLPCALFIGGAYFGITGDFERFAELSLQDHLPAQFVPEGTQPISCFLSETLPTTPPEHMEVYRLPDGIALRACNFPPSDFSLKPIAQVRNDKTAVTVYQQGGIQVSMETPFGFFNTPLPLAFSECHIEIHGEFIFLHGKNMLAIFHKNGRKLLQERCLQTSIEEEKNGMLLHATLPLSDHFQRTAKCVYRLSETQATRLQYTLQTTVPTQQNIDGLFVYAFLESVRIGADVTPFLCDALQEKADELHDFLGDFLYVVPTNDPCKCLLVYKKGERLYDVCPFTATLQNGKITDLQG